MNTACRLLLGAILFMTLPGCAPSTKAIMQAESSALELRSFQQRAFDTSDVETTMRTVIATLQDLGFVVDKADLDLGTVSATKASTYAYVNPIIAVVLGWAFANEPIGVRTLVAAAIILGGVALITMQQSGVAHPTGEHPVPAPEPGDGTRERSAA